MTQLAPKPISAEAQYHYCIVRTDASTWPAQLGHAAAESAVNAERIEAGLVKVGTCNFVALAAKDADVLAKAKAQLENYGIIHWDVVETDGPYAGQRLAIGVLPGPKLDFLRWLPCIKVHAPS